MNESERNRTKAANSLALAIYLKKRNSVAYANFFDRFSAAVPADGVCCGSALLRYIHANHMLENINFFQKDGSCASSKSFTGFLVLARKVKVMETSAKFESLITE